MLKVDQIEVYNGTTLALRKVSLQVEEGRVVAVVGSNGAGKSTLLRTISGLLKPVSGQIIFQGSRIEGLPAHQIAAVGISHIPEGRRLFPNMTVMQNLELGSYTKKAKEKRHENLERVFSFFPLLNQRMDQKAGTLSGGEQQLLAIGRGLMSDPKLLMLDEPSTGLAPVYVQKLYAVLKEITSREELTILLVEQNVHAALSVADIGYVLENGVVLQAGTAESLLENDLVKKAYLGLT